MKFEKVFLIFVCFVLVILLTGCEDLGGKGPLTPTFGGKGVGVVFVPGEPPLNEIDGPFSLGIKFENYNMNDIGIDDLIIGSTWQHEGFTNIEGESIVLEKALTREAQENVIFLGPGGIHSYVGSGEKLRDGSIHYGDFEFGNVGVGEGTQFYVDMSINDYKSTSVFQFCIFDMLDSKFSRGCPAIETIGNLGFASKYDPVVVTSIRKTLTPGTGNLVKIKLDVFIEDKSVNKQREKGNVIKEEVGEQELEILSFEIEPTGVDVGFTCKSDTQLISSNSNYLKLSLLNGEAKVECVGYDRLLEESINYQYRINLGYPYRQRITTKPIKVRATAY